MFSLAIFTTKIIKYVHGTLFLAKTNLPRFLLDLLMLDHLLLLLFRIFVVVKLSLGDQMPLKLQLVPVILRFVLYTSIAFVDGMGDVCLCFS